MVQPQGEVSFIILGFPGGSAGKESTCNVGDLGSIPGLGRSLGEGKGCPLQCSGLENPMDYGVHGVTKSQTRLSDFHSFFSSETTCCRRWQGEPLLVFSSPRSSCGLASDLGAVRGNSLQHRVNKAFSAF